RSRDFDARFDAYIESERSGNRGALLLLQIQGLIEYNNQHGRDAGDDCLLSIASTLKEVVVNNEAIIGRRSGADFSIFVPELDEAEAKQLAEEIINSLSRRSWYESKELLPYVGAACSEVIDRDNKLLSQADMALRQAQHHCEGGGNWSLAEPDDASNARPAREWGEMISNAIDRRAFVLHYQPVFDAAGDCVHLEVLCRLQEGEELLTAGVFWPMVERFHLSADLDKVLIDMLAEQNPEGERILCVNISPNSLHNDDFLPWLEQFMRSKPDFAKRLQLELPAQMLEADEALLRAVVKQLTPLCAGVSLDHFGVAGSEFMHLQSIDLRMLKVDMRFTHSMDPKSDSRFYVETLLKIARSCDLTLYAEGIETEEQWQAVKELGLDGGQGYYLGRPSDQLQ
ncbi:MAG: EAL domain-containing protein, partial [Cellvibrionaceae bacterium]|nr:EAL domain-containing protein [Cellvibrionaceae bacterium]